MSEELQKAPRREFNFSSVVASRRDKMFGVAEIIALAGSCFVLFLVLLSYLYFYVPARSRRSTIEGDRLRLKANTEKLGGIVRQEKSTKETVDEITSSLTKFETVSLRQQDSARMGLYGELNQLILKHGLRNTTGPAYTELSPLGEKVTPGTSVSTKWQSVYPGIGVLLTVEGPYQNLRHFVQDIERSEQFVIINQVELQRAENSSQIAEAAQSSSGSRVSLVSLQLNMSTYFQRQAAGNGQE
jgi:Tfp pilus assembly protein PilO